MLTSDYYTESPAPIRGTPAYEQAPAAHEGWSAGTASAPTTPLYPRQAEGPVWAPGTDGMPPMLPPPGSGVDDGGKRKRRPTWRAALVVVALILALAGGIGLGKAFNLGGTTTIGGQMSLTVPMSASSLQQTLQAVAAAVEPSVVEITSQGSSGTAIGSGDILTSDGYIVTNDHVVDGYSTFTVTLQNGTQLAAQVVGTDPQDDLAVIKVSATNLKPITFADSSKVTVGEFAVAIGNPLGQRETATFGTVSAINRTESESPSGPAAILTGLIQTSAPIAPGNSGGALVNLQGQLIGIPTLGASSQRGGSNNSTTTIGFAIPSNQVKSVATQIIQTGHATATAHGFLGIQGQDVTPAIAAQNGLSTQSGVLVAGYANDAAGQSAAQAAGLQTGDVIVAVNGQTISNSSDLATAVATQAPGTSVTLTVVRGTSQTTIHLTLGARPAA